MLKYLLVVNSIYINLRLKKFESVVPSLMSVDLRF
ncbi:hypothetical protein Osc7112_1509 [Oscillatoria nigro-viridis PCC 7112]|uniref:Uncharacterized protein n=1 Tax=Phormidium nigroviride PCC 7112 TaxID=179408 RepID=K9VFN6_9CYAN|nr:hypothetical protein Osc7112_1509 [Oscillatoria nigro-viridis PCC 7112]